MDNLAIGAIIGAILGLIIGWIFGYKKGRFRAYSSTFTFPGATAQVFGGNICVKGQASSGGLIPYKVVAKVYANSSGIPAHPEGEAGTTSTTTIDGSGNYEMAAVPSNLGGQVLAVWDLYASRTTQSFTGVTHPTGTDCTAKTLTASGNWTVPTGWNTVDIECWGGGGGGNNLNKQPGGGGGGGGYSKASGIAVTAGTNISIQVGAGGAFASGAAGGDTIYPGAAHSADICVAKGGGGASNANGGAGGAAGTGTVTRTGGAGGTANGTTGGGGGSSAGTAANGNAGMSGGAGGAGGAAVANGGGGGGGGTNGGAAGTAGLAPGGGGGGGNGTNGGAGASGQAVITKVS